MKREPKDGAQVWGAQVWFGSGDAKTNIRRYYYATRRQARAADISDDIGTRGRVA